MRYIILKYLLKHNFNDLLRTMFFNHAQNALSEKFNFMVYIICIVVNVYVTSPGGNSVKNLDIYIITEKLKVKPRLRKSLVEELII